jgi:hypothetical protein
MKVNQLGDIIQPLPCYPQYNGFVKRVAMIVEMKDYT